MPPLRHDVPVPDRCWRHLPAAVRRNLPLNLPAPHRDRFIRRVKSSVAQLPGITIGKPGDTCAASGHRLEVGDRIVSVLVLAPGEGSRRLDVAEARWNEGWRPDAGDEVVAIWRGVVPEPKPTDRNRPVDDEDLVSFFEQLTEPADDQAVELRYVLAWMLLRRRRLRLEGQRGNVLRVRRVTATGGLIDAEPIDVTDPGLDEDQLEHAMERVALLLLGEPEPSPTTPATGEAS